MLVKFLFLKNEFIHNEKQTYMNGDDEPETDTEKKFIGIYQNEAEIFIIYLQHDELE